MMFSAGDEVVIRADIADEYMQPYRNFAKSGRRGIVRDMNRRDNSRILVEFPPLKGRGYVYKIDINPDHIEAA